MRIHLISPTHYLRDGSLHKTTRYWTSGITLPYLKALTPREHDVTFTDELMQELDVAKVEREADVVGITAMGPRSDQCNRVDTEFVVARDTLGLFLRGLERLASDANGEPASLSGDPDAIA